MKVKILLIITLVFISLSTSPHSPKSISNNIDERLKIVLEDTNWEIFVEALIFVESRGDSLAKNKTSSASGLFQQLTIYVDECNRLIGRKLYSYEDRFKPGKARQMFDIVQGYYNPKRDIKRAMKLHLGKESKVYQDAIISQMEVIRSTIFVNLKDE